MGSFFKFINVLVLVSYCSGGTVKRDTSSSSQNEIPNLSYFDLYGGFSHYHQYNPQHPREALCGSLRNLLSILHDSGVTTCRQLPKEFNDKGKFYSLIIEC